ncbi:MAG: ABC transporter permease [Colwellia sp.]|nr:ABC transporter permease [Colwellia sp.]
MIRFLRYLKFELLLAKSALLTVPGFSATVIATLSVTLGALICIFSLNHLLLVKSLPYPNAEKLVVVQQSYASEGETYSGSQSAPGMLLWYKNQQVFDKFALVFDHKQLVADHPEQPSALINFITPEYFSLLMPKMHLGRVIDENEAIDTHQAVVVLSYQAWQKWYQSDADIIGRKTMIGHVSYKVIGVTSEHFIAPANRYNEAPDLWLPWDYQGMDVNHWGIMTRALSSIGILKPGISPQQATPSLGAMLNEKYTASEAAEGGDTASAKILTLNEVIVGDSSKTVLLLLSGVVGLLLIAVTNVTNLFLSRAAQKQRTMAIQAALGAKPNHLFIAMFAESLILSVIAGALGLLVAGWGFVLLEELAARQLPRISELGLDSATLMFTGIVVVVLSAIFAKLSSRVVNYDLLQSQLQSSGKGSGLQVSKRTRNFLIAIQVALATLLLAGASVVIEKALETALHPLGFNDDDVYYLRVDRPKGANYSPESLVEMNLLTLSIKKELENLPQVKQVSRSIKPVIFKGSNSMTLDDRDGKRVGSFAFNMVDHNYFDILELPIVEGNTFSEQKDPRYQINEIILSESLAHELAPNGDAIGKVFQLQMAQPLKVIGIAKDYYRPGMKGDYGYQRYYMPYAAFEDFGFDIKLTPGAKLSRETVLPLLLKLNAKLRIRTVISHKNQHADLIYKHKLTAGLTIVLSLLSLLLAAAGIYGVLNYSTQMRRYELGIHLALGAKTHRIINMVLKESLYPVLLGMLISAGLSVIIFIIVRQQVNFVININYIGMLSVVPIMLAVAYIACYIPIRAAISEDPIKALRNE